MQTPTIEETAREVACHGCSLGLPIEYDWDEGPIHREDGAIGTFYSCSASKDMDDEQQELVTRIATALRDLQRRTRAETERATRQQVVGLEGALVKIARFAVGNGDVCEIIARIARDAIGEFGFPGEAGKENENG